MATIHHNVITKVDRHEQDALHDLDQDTKIEVEASTDDDTITISCGGAVLATISASSGLAIDKISELTGSAGITTADTLELGAAIDGNGNVITKTPAGINTQTASYELVEADGNKLIPCNHASVAIVVTLPTGLDTGFTCTVVRQGAAAVSFACAGTIISKGSNVILNGIGTGAMCVHLGANTWWLVGDLT